MYVWLGQRKIYKRRNERIEQIALDLTWDERDIKETRLTRLRHMNNTGQHNQSMKHYW